jgi:hypothetical protein
VSISVDYGNGSGLVQVYQSGDPVGDALVAYNKDFGGNTFEAHSWETVQINAGLPFMLALGYADNVHQDICGTTDCFPGSNFGVESPGHHFIGAPLPAGTWGICTSNCYDGGALLITAVAPSGKSIQIGPSSMEGAIKIDAGDWVNGGYSFKTNFTGNIGITATVSITGKCIGGSQPTDTLVVPLGTIAYAAQAGSDWKPTGDQNSILSWQGSVIAPTTLCGGGGAELDGSKGAVFNATITGVPTGGLVTFRFKFRDPAAKGKHNTNCLDATDPYRNKADVCGASWSATKTDP